MQPDVEKSFRLGSIAMMKAVCDKLLKTKVGETLDYKVLGREVMYTAVVLFNRYFTRHSILEKAPTRSDIVFGALLLAMKCEDFMGALPSVVHSLVRFYQDKVLKLERGREPTDAVCAPARCPNVVSACRAMSQENLIARDAINAAEFSLLTTLEFDYDVQHPAACYKALIDALGIRTCCYLLA